MSSRGPPSIVGLKNPKRTNWTILPVLAIYPSMSSSNSVPWICPTSLFSVLTLPVTISIGDWAVPLLHTGSFPTWKWLLKLIDLGQFSYQVPLAGIIRVWNSLRFIFPFQILFTLSIVIIWRYVDVTDTTTVHNVCWAYKIKLTCISKF